MQRMQAKSQARAKCQFFHSERDGERGTSNTLLVSVQVCYSNHRISQGQNSKTAFWFLRPVVYLLPLQKVREEEEESDQEVARSEAVPGVNGPSAEGTSVKLTAGSDSPCHTHLIGWRDHCFLQDKAACVIYLIALTKTDHPRQQLKVKNRVMDPDLGLKDDLLFPLCLVHTLRKHLWSLHKHFIDTDNF